MIVPFITLACLVSLIPALDMFDPNRAAGMASAILAVTALAVAVTLPSTTSARLNRLLRPALIVVLIAPALWIAVQFLPMPAHALANPIWASASAALKQPFAGAITIDIGATLLSLAQYAVVLAAALVTTAVALDRQRAETILHILLTIAALMAARRVALDLGIFDQSRFGWPDEDGTGAVFAVTGILLSCATVLHAYDRLQRSGRPRASGRGIFVPISVAVIAFLICAAALFIRADVGDAVAALVGAATLSAAFAIRRWLFGPWGKASVAAAAAVGLFAAFTAVPVKKDADIAVALSSQNLTTTEQMLSDVPTAGSGAGTFEALLPVYRDASAVTSHEMPTAAAAITIEMGRPFLACLIIAAVAGALILFSRSLSRGQDYVYAATGAGAMLAFPVTAFLNGGILSLGASLLAGVLFGLATAQSLGSARKVEVLEAQEPAIDADQRRDKGPRTLRALDGRGLQIAFTVFGLALTAQAAWILSVEKFVSGPLALTAARDAPSSGPERDTIRTAARIAVVRGDLWAASALAEVARPSTGPTSKSGTNALPDSALGDLNRALRYAPHRGDAWLMLALLAQRYKLSGYDAAALLKMSYYTAPNDPELLASRLHLALGTDIGVADPELQDQIRRDVRLVLTRVPALRPALVAAYKSAPLGRKLELEGLIAEVDPGYLKAIRAQQFDVQ